MSWFIDSIALVPLYPLLAFVLILLGRITPVMASEDGKKQPLLPKAGAMVLTVASTVMGLLHSGAALSWLVSQKEPALATLEQNWHWLQVGGLNFSLGTLIDAPAVMMLLVVTFISLFIQIYTHGYMRHDKGYAKFFAYLALFNMSMLGLVLSSNLFQTYIFWELVGLCSYLLIGFWTHKPDAAKASFKAFMVNRFGDFGFLTGILMLFSATLPFWTVMTKLQPQMATLSFQALSQLAPSITSVIPEPWLWIVGFLLFLGPMAKSAQVPLHTWLPDAMAGPTPISALIHAATMVAAGVFLVGRLFPLFSQSEGLMMSITLIGLVTAFVGATIALTQNDIKKALAYSTMSQLGFMMTAMGLGAYTAALFHLFTHAFFKAMLFLGSGSVIHACEDEQDMRKMGGLWSKLPVTAWTYLLGTIAISGLAWTSGFWSKDEILLAAQQSQPWVFNVLALTAGMTSFYMFRTFFMTFCGKYRGEAHVHHEDAVMTMPLLVLAVPSVLVGWAVSGINPTWLSFPDLLVSSAPSHLHHHAPGFFTAIANQSQLIGLTGLAFAYWLYILSPGFLSQGWLKALLSPFYALSQGKWFFDDMLQGIVEFGYMGVARVSALFDSLVVDGLVRGTANTVKASGSVLRQVQSGAVQTYLAVMILSVLALLYVVLRVA
jgi:proton-translocating NADH-quinone oxidoreductase chain L